jgi:hypothetical protein
MKLEFRVSAAKTGVFLRINKKKVDSAYGLRKLFNQLFQLKQGD